MEAEDLSRKKKVRAAHRASVTCMIAQARELLTAEGAPDLPKLRHKRDGITAKAELLSKLDEDIVEAVREDELDGEIEGADLVRERIELTIIDLDSALTTAMEPGRRRDSDPERVAGREREPPSPADLTRDSSRGGGERSHDPSHREGGHRVDPPPTGPSRSTSPEGTHTSTSPATHSAEPALVVPAATPSSPHVRLPKLSLKKFGGDVTKWTTFWDTFESSVHRNAALTDMERFSYLSSLLESDAAEAIAGLTLTSANYTEAVGTLKRRFGNKQTIINRHMDILLHLEPVASPYHLKGLRQLLDAVESNVRGLKSLGVEASCYGGLLSSILMSRLPADLRLIMSRGLREDAWSLESMMEIFRREIEARERSAGARPSVTRKPPKLPSTALSLTTGTLIQATCAYCDQPHPSGTCPTVIDPAERKRLLRAKGRCYVCLRRNHVSRTCRSSTRCTKCRGRHHTSICVGASDGGGTPPGLANPDAGQSSLPPSGSPRTPTTQSMCVNSHTPILLQTAKAIVCDASQHPGGPQLEVRAILDSGSQRSYVTAQVREALNARRLRSELMVIKTFGAEQGASVVYDVVELTVATRDGEALSLPMVVVPHICDPVRTQPIDLSKTRYAHLSGLQLADSCPAADDFQIELLIGSDHYWKIVTGTVLKANRGPTAIETRLGWVLSGPAEGLMESASLTFTTQSSHVLRVECEDSLDERLRGFWDLESLGILKEERSFGDEFVQQISFSKGRYEVHLPWKESHPHLPDHYDLCRRRLAGLLRRLGEKPEQMQLYDSVIRDQLRQGIIEVVDDPTTRSGERLHYLPHHGVFRHNKLTTKLRIVYAASAKTVGPSLNDCLHIGPNFGQNMLDILVRFRIHPIVLIGDVEKAFLMVSVAECDRDVLRFLWVADVTQSNSDVIVLRFTRVVFGVSASPFLLNATLDHHVRRLEAIDRPFVEKFRRSVYVDDVVMGSPTVEDGFAFYLQARVHLAKASFNLRKFMSNSVQLREKIHENERKLRTQDSQESGHSPDALPDHDTVQQVLGVTWDVGADEIVLDVSDIAHLMKETQPTKRSAVSLATRVYDPLGVISPITVRFKLLFQRLCEKGVDWDEPLSGELLAEWQSLVSDLQRFTSIRMPRCCSQLSGVRSYSLEGYCDASQRAYAAVVYLRTETDDASLCRFLCSKTRVAPVKKVTIPRLELLSALLLARLISTVQRAVEQEILVDDITCYCDSKVALFWITGEDKVWKQFVQNRVTEVRQLVPIASWRHCAGEKNPADIPSRGVSPLELTQKMELWLNGPSEPPLIERAAVTKEMTLPPEGCLVEMTVKAREKIAVSLVCSSSRTTVLPCEGYSTLSRLLRVTAYILRFVTALKEHGDRERRACSQTTRSLTAEEIGTALTYWLKISQVPLPETKQFPQWSMQFGLFQDGHGVWRCGGRLENSKISVAAKNPILLNKQHYVTRLIVRECHERVMHGGVKATLTELRARYWLVQGRNYIRGVLHQCTLCRRFQGKPYSPPPAPPLPDFRVSEQWPFSYTGVDFAGPLYVRDTVGSPARKAWLCLYTCCSTRAVHLDVIPDMTAEAFLWCFRRFSARRGFPRKMVSDNAKTFKAAAKALTAIIESSTVTRYLSNVGVRWSFNVARAPWWGGVFERMIQTVKRCLRKTIGNARLTFEELLTSVVEAEMTVNSRPLSYYVSSEDFEEPLTPSHLLCGHRVLSLPDPSLSNDEEYNPSPSHDDLTKRMRHLNKTLNDFWRRWRLEYLLELREQHRYLRTPKGAAGPINVGDVVIVHEDNLPRGLWRLGRVQKLIDGADNRVRSAVVRVGSQEQRPGTIKRPIQRLYPLEVRSLESADRTTAAQTDPPDGRSPSVEDPPHVHDALNESTQSVRESGGRPRRQAALRAQDTIREWCDDLNRD